MDLLFPSLITSYKDKDVKKYQKEFINYCYLLKKNNSGVALSNSGGWHSETDIHLRSDFKFLDLITNLINSTITNFHLKSCSISLNSLWININPQYSYNNLHIHSGNHLSGVFYLKAPKNCGNIVFKHERSEINSLHTFIREEYLKIINLYPTYKYTPEEGRIFLFDSIIPHYVEQNLSQEDRISISFNLSLINT